MFMSRIHFRRWFGSTIILKNMSVKYFWDFLNLYGTSRGAASLIFWCFGYWSLYTLGSQVCRGLKILYVVHKIHGKQSQKNLSGLVHGKPSYSRLAHFLMPAHLPMDGCSAQFSIWVLKFCISRMHKLRMWRFSGSVFWGRLCDSARRVPDCAG